MCKGRLGELDPEDRRIAAIALSKQSEPEKLIALHEIEGNKTARLYQEYFLTQLSDEQRRQPDMLRLSAERLLRDGRFSDALCVVEDALVAQRSAQLLYWRAWCLAIGGRMEEAQAAFGELERDFPDSPWNAPAQELIALLPTAEQSLDKQAEATTAILRPVREDGLQQFEAVLEWQWRDSWPLRITIALDTVANLFELHIVAKGSTLAAYRSAPEDSRAYIAGDPSILAFREPGKLPSFALRLRRRPDGSYNTTFDGSMQLSNDARGAAGSVESLLNSPLLSDRSELAAMLKQTACRNGALPRAVLVQGDKTTLEWVIPEIAEPAIRSVRCRIDASTHQIEIEGDPQGRVTLRFGAAGSFMLAPLQWPDLPVTHHEQIQVSHLFRMVAAAMTVFAE